MNVTQEYETIISMLNDVRTTPELNSLLLRTDAWKLNIVAEQKRHASNSETTLCSQINNSRYLNMNTCIDNATARIQQIEFTSLVFPSAWETTQMYNEMIDTTSNMTYNAIKRDKMRAGILHIIKIKQECRTRINVQEKTKTLLMDLFDKCSTIVHMILKYQHVWHSNIRASPLYCHHRDAGEAMCKEMTFIDDRSLALY